MAKFTAIAWPDLWNLKFESAGATGRPLGTTPIPAELTDAVIARYMTHGIKLFRLAFKWEFIQPTLGGSLDSAYLGRILYGCRAAVARGCKVILDLHSVDLQRESLGTSVGYISQSGAVTYAHLQDFWQKFTQAVKSDAGGAWAGVFALEIMNEPGQGANQYGVVGTWLGNHTPSGSGYRAAIAGIRSVDATIPILVSGEGFTGTNTWTSLNSAMVLPDHNCYVVGHCYFDTNFSGTYGGQSFYTNHGRATLPSEESGITATSAQARFDNWLNWLASKTYPDNGQPYNGMVTEFGVPYNGGTATDWQAILQAVCSKLDAAPRVLGWSAWTGGGAGIGDSQSWQYNGSQGIPPWDPTGTTQVGPVNGHWTVLGLYPTAAFSAGSSGQGTTGAGLSLSPSYGQPQTAGGQAGGQPATPPLVVYDDAFENGFAEFSSFGGATGGPASPPVPYRGSSALGITFGAQFGAYGVRTAPFAAASYQVIRGQILITDVTPAGSRDVGFSLMDSAGTGIFGSKVTITVPTPNVWTPFSILVATLAGGNATISGVYISEQSGSAQDILYIDDLAFANLTLSGAGANNPPSYGQGTTDRVIGALNMSGAGLSLSPSYGAGQTAGGRAVAASLMVYDDAYENGFIENGSFFSATAVPFTATGAPNTPPAMYNGNSALAVTYPTAFGAVLWRTPTAFSSALYTHVSFALWSPIARQIGISAVDASGTGLYSNKVLVTISVVSGWQVYTVSVKTLTAGAALSLSGLAISDQSGVANQPAMYVDDLRFADISAGGLSLANPPSYGVGSTNSAGNNTFGSGLANVPAYGSPVTLASAGMSGVGLANPPAYGSAVSQGLIAATGTGAALAPNYGVGVSNGVAAMSGAGLANPPSYGAPATCVVSPANGAGTPLAASYGVPTSAVGVAATSGVNGSQSVNYGGGTTSTTAGAQNQSVVGVALALAVAPGSPATAASVAGTAGAGLNNPPGLGVGTSATGAGASGVGLANASAYGAGVTTSAALALAGTSAALAPSVGQGSTATGVAATSGAGLANPPSYGVGRSALPVGMSGSGFALASAYGAANTVAVVIVPLTGVSQAIRYGLASTLVPGRRPRIHRGHLRFIVMRG
jgi:hypothetical protein